MSYLLVSSRPVQIEAALQQNISSKTTAVLMHLNGESVTYQPYLRPRTMAMGI